MGCKYTVEALAEHDGEGYSMAQVWAGQSLLTALYSLWITKRAGYCCVTLTIR